jgi:hypothetical protein
MSWVKSRVFALLFVVSNVVAAPAVCQEYIVMGTPSVNIRTGPGTDHVIAGRAEKGDIYKVVSADGGWYKIEMFSGDYRYVVSESYVYDLTPAQLVSGHRMELPESEKVCRSIYRSIAMAKDRAMKEADEIIPASIDKERNTSFRKIMEDRIILEMCHIYGLQPALYDDFRKKGAKNGW